MNRFLILLFSVSFVIFESSASDIRVGNIYIERQDVFESNDPDWFFLSPLMNSLHTRTYEYIIRDELLFKENEMTDYDYLMETERNIRSIGLFTSVILEVDSIGFNSYDVYITTKDRWSTYPALLFGTGGGEINYGGRLEEHNFAGTGTYIGAEALYRSVNDIGWQGNITLSQRRLFRSEIGGIFSLTANQYRTDQYAYLAKPFRTLDTKYSYGVAFSNSFGSNFIFNTDEDPILDPFHIQKGVFHFSRSWMRHDRIFAGVGVELDKTDRGLLGVRQAYDNSGKILLQFSSVSQDYYSVSKINYYNIEDMPVGGYGSATLGKVISLGDDGENLFYVGAQGEISHYKNNLYLFGKMTGATSFKRSAARYTYQDFIGTAFYKISDAVILTSRVWQQATWNWFAFRQLILDNERGLRGYKANDLVGDNRLISNTELRWFPDVPVWIFNFSGAIFYDIGAVWKRETAIFDSKFHSSVGAGIRFHFTKSASPSHTFRVDFAYNMDEKKFGGIIFSTRQLFSAFGTHDFQLPSIFGREIDLE